MLDMVIIGAGPAGLAASREARDRGLDFVVLERGSIADTILQYPIAKPLFSTPDELELYPGGLRCRDEKPTREELLAHYTNYVVDGDVPVHTEEAVERIDRAAEGFVVRTARGGAYPARTVLVATGINGERKRLNVSGETDERVSYRFIEGFPWARHDVLVAGSGNSAAEAAIFLAEVGARVTLAMRRRVLEAGDVNDKDTIKPWVRAPLLGFVESGRVALHLSTRVAAIGERDAGLETLDGAAWTIRCDHVFALLGTRADARLLRQAGAAFDADGVVAHDPKTFETSVPGLFVAGHLTRERHIKGAIQVAPRVVAEIAARLVSVGA